MGVVKAIKKGAKKLAKLEAKRLRVGGKVLDLFIPGVGKVSEEMAAFYSGLSKSEKKKFSKAKTKKQKIKFLLDLHNEGEDDL